MFCIWQVESELNKDEGGEFVNCYVKGIRGVMGLTVNTPKV